GGMTASVTVSTSSGNGIASATASPDQFSLNPESSRTINLTVQTSDSLHGETEISTTFSYGTGTATATVTVREKREPGTLTITSAPDTVNIQRGNTSTLHFTVSNTGEQRIDSITSRFEQYTSTITPTTFALVPNESRIINVTVSIPRDENISIRNLTFEASSSKASDATHIRLRIQPATEQTREQIIQNIEQLKDRVSRIKDTDTQTVVQNMLDTASKALSRGNYAKAAAIADEIQARVAEAELRQKQDRGFPLLPIAVLFLVLAAGGYSGYYLLKQRGTEKTQHTATHAPSHDTKEEPSMKEQASKILDNIRETAQSAASFLSRPSDTDSTESTDSTGETRVKKKIRFEDIEDE
ncbi:MAG: hypothetical protein SVU32_01080, partial [Candidatus Nanohaloarchaea archaeon]|nr:hypothetical protein [Candidatus Nanohaloarchaea archaeon]